MPKEHVIPQNWGKFTPDLTLRCVCKECNHYFGSKLEWPMLRQSVEGMRRLQFGFKGRVGGIRTDGVEPVHGIDSKRLLTEQRTFADSRGSIELQLCDMLAAILRRALNGQLQQHGWKDFGKLLIRHHDPSDGFVQLDPGKDVYMPARAKEVWQMLDRKAKAMVAEGSLADGAAGRRSPLRPALR